MIRELGKERTVLLSTHILSEAQQICDRVLIINKGRIVADDTPERLQSRLAGAQKVVLKVAGDTDGLEGVINGVPGIVRTSPSVEGGLEFETIPGQDVRPQVARAVINAGYDLLELRSIGLSLEDIFMQLTREEPQPPAIAEEIAEVGEEKPEETSNEYLEE
jgi:ABC-2 type transport system ATP-binding protein